MFRSLTALVPLLITAAASLGCQGSPYHLMSASPEALESEDISIKKLCIAYHFSKHKDEQIADELVRRYVLTPSDVERVNNFQLQRGDSIFLVYAMFGEPWSRNVYDAGGSIQLVWRHRVFVYLGANGKVTNWQMLGS